MAGGPSETPERIEVQSDGSFEVVCGNWVVRMRLDRPVGVTLVAREQTSAWPAATTGRRPQAVPTVSYGGGLLGDVGKLLAQYPTVALQEQDAPSGAAADPGILLIGQFEDLAHLRSSVPDLADLATKVGGGLGRPSFVLGVKGVDGGVHGLGDELGAANLSGVLVPLGGKDPAV